MDGDEEDGASKGASNDNAKSNDNDNSIDKSKLDPRKHHSYESLFHYIKRNRPEYANLKQSEFNLVPCIPNATPGIRQTNPYCPSSTNKTGWIVAPCPKKLYRSVGPMNKKQRATIPGTDDKAPRLVNPVWSYTKVIF